MEDNAAKGHKDGDKKKKKKKKRDQKKKKRSCSSSASSSGDVSSSSSTPLFGKAPARGGGEIWKVAKKKPGRLTEIALQEMARYVSGSHHDGERGDWSNQKVLSYLNQIVLTNHPPSKIGVRAHRELVTLATCMDELLASNTLQCLDILTQRFKAVELSIQDGSWNLARHVELIPPSAAQLSREEERLIASKAELNRLKLADAAHKATKNK